MYSRVYIEITNICNMSCSFCHGHSREKRLMSLEEFGHILSKLEGQTRYVYYHLMGEPLLHPQLTDFIKAATEKGFRSVITTNGTLLEKNSEKLISSGVHKVSVSLHSFEKNNPTAQKEYLRDIVSFAEAATRAGIIVVLRLWNKGFDENRNDITLDYLRTSIQGEWVDNTRGIRIHDKLHIEWGDRFEWPDKAAPVQSDDVFCYGLRDHFGILCDGSVVPCCLDSEGELTLGNIFISSIDEILNSPAAVAMKEGFDKRRAITDLCRRCGYAQRFK